MANDLKMTVDELNDFLFAAFEGGRPYQVDSLEPDRAQLSLPIEQLVIRPGGTVSGPTLMMLADASAWAVVLAHIGPVALAVTSNLTINFLRKPEPVGVVAHAELLKLGRKQAVTDVRMYSDGQPDLVAQATVTYAIPSSDWNR
jgi:uncharacterized protein (TIGR00369 family)